jgi:hypothetical protein
MALHVHAEWLPQVPYAAGAIVPYPVTVGPTNVAQSSLSAFRQILMPAFNPVVKQEPTPESVARMAKRLADAMAAGMQPPAWTDRRLVEAANMINRGQSFTIRSAGREAVVNAGPTPITASPMEPGRTLSRSY